MATWGTGISLKGVKGDAGLSILTNTGAPANTLGFDGQIYIDTATFDAYLRTNGTWAKQRNLVGPMGMNGYSGQIVFGPDIPTPTTTDGKADALYIRTSNGEVYSYDAEGSKVWVDTGYSLIGPPGPAGAPGSAGQRGTQTYTGNGAPSANLASFTPPAVAGDLYYQLDGGPTLYVLGN